jgi:hypothetical protein
MLGLICNYCGTTSPPHLAAHWIAMAYAALANFAAGATPEQTQPLVGTPLAEWRHFCTPQCAASWLAAGCKSFAEQLASTDQQATS